MQSETMQPVRSAARVRRPLPTPCVRNAAIRRVIHVVLHAHVNVATMSKLYLLGVAQSAK